MTKKKIAALISILCASSMLIACGAEMPELTDEQTALVDEYAASLLLKYDTNSTSRLLSEEEMQSSVTIPVGPQTAAEQEESIDIAQTTDEPLVSADDVTVTDTDGTVTAPEGGDSTSGGSGWSDYIGDAGFDIAYAGNYETVDSYPADDPNAYFTMDASSGNKLLVLHFTLTNNTGSDLEVNMNDYPLKYRVSVNGQSNTYVLTTMLSNDILSYKGTVEAGGSEDLIAVAEISDADAQEISSIVFTIRGESGSSELTLK